MGSWGTDILANDKSLDVWEYYFELLEKGLSSSVVKNRILMEEENGSTPELFDNTFFWFGLAKAQLDSSNVDEQIVGVVQKIVDEGIDLEEYWSSKQGLLLDRRQKQLQFLEDLIESKRKQGNISKRKDIFLIQLGHVKIKPNTSFKESVFDLFQPIDEAIFIFWQRIPIHFTYGQNIKNSIDQIIKMLDVLIEKDTGEERIVLGSHLLDIIWNLSWEKNKLIIEAAFNSKEFLYNDYAGALNSVRIVQLKKEDFLKEWKSLFAQLLKVVQVVGKENLDKEEQNKWGLVEEITDQITEYGILYTK